MAEKISSINPQQNLESQNESLKLSPEQIEVLNQSVSDKIKRAILTVAEKVQTYLDTPEVKKLIEADNFYELLIQKFNKYSPELQKKIIAKLSVQVLETKNPNNIRVVLEKFSLFENSNIDLKALYQKLIELNPSLIAMHKKIFAGLINANELADGLLLDKGGNYSFNNLAEYYKDLSPKHQNYVVNQFLRGSGGLLYTETKILEQNEYLLKILYKRALQARRFKRIDELKELFIRIKSWEEIKVDLKRIGWKESFPAPQTNEVKNSEDELNLIKDLIASERIDEILLLLDKEIKFVNKSEIISMILESKNGYQHLIQGRKERFEKYILNEDTEYVDRNIDALIKNGEIYLLSFFFYKLDLEKLGNKIIDQGGYLYLRDVIRMFPESIRERFEEETNKNKFTKRNVKKEINLTKRSLEAAKSQEEKEKLESIISGLEYLYYYERVVRAELSESLGSDIVEHFLKNMDAVLHEEQDKFCKIAMKENISPIQAIGLFQSKINKFVNERVLAFKAMNAHDLLYVLNDRFRSQHELPGNKRSSIASVRTFQDERRLFGRNLTEVGAEKAPIYGYPSTIENSLSAKGGDVSLGLMGLAGYGSLSVRFRIEEIRGKTTMNFEDSLGSPNLFTFLSHPHFASFTNGGYGGDGNESVYLAFNELDDPDFSINTTQFNRSGTGYSEIHIHNTVLPTDIEEIIIDETRKGYFKETTAKIKEEVEKFNQKNPDRQIKVRICRTDEVTGGVFWIE